MIGKKSLKFIGAPFSPRNEYIRALLVIFFSSFLISFIIGYLNYRGFMEENQVAVQNQYLEVAHRFKWFLENYQFIFKEIGRAISERKTKATPEDIKKILSHYTQHTQNFANQEISGLMWMENHPEAIIVNQYGVLHTHPKLGSHLLRELKIYPNNVLISPVFKDPTLLGTKIIILGLGVNDTEGKLTGVILARIAVDDLADSIRVTTLPKSMGLLVKDQQDEVLFTDTDLKKHSKFNKGTKTNHFNWFANRNEISFSYQYKDLPLSVIVFYKGNALLDFINKHAFFQICVTFGIICLLFFTFIVYRKKIKKGIYQTYKNKLITLSQENSQLMVHKDKLSKIENYKAICEISDPRKNRLAAEFHSRTQSVLGEIIENSKILTENFFNGSKHQLPLDRQCSLLMRIHESALGVSNMSIVSSNYIALNIYDVIKDSIFIISKKAFVQEINIVPQIQSELSPIFCDEVALKQVITSLLTYSIGMTPKGKTTHIVAEKESIQGKDYLKIIIKDEGFGIDENKMNQFASKEQDKDPVDCTTLSWPSIERIVRTLRGSITKENILGQGQTINLFIPYISNPPKNPELPRENNVYYFPKK